MPRDQLEHPRQRRGGVSPMFRPWSDPQRVGVSADRTMPFDGPGYGGSNVEWVGGHCSIGNQRTFDQLVHRRGSPPVPFDGRPFSHQPLPGSGRRPPDPLLDRDSVLKGVRTRGPAHYPLHRLREQGKSAGPNPISAIVDSRPARPAPSPHPATTITVERAHVNPFHPGLGRGPQHHRGSSILRRSGTCPKEPPRGSTVRARRQPRPGPCVPGQSHCFESDPPAVLRNVDPLSRKTISTSIKSSLPPPSRPRWNRCPAIPRSSPRGRCTGIHNPWVQWVAGHATIRYS